MMGQKVTGISPPPRQQLHWQNVSEVNIWELWSLLMASDQFWFIFLSTSDLSTVATTHLPFPALCQAAIYMFPEQLAHTQLLGATVDRKDPVIDFRNLCSDVNCCFCSKKCRVGWPLLHLSPWCKSLFLQLK